MSLPALPPDNKYRILVVEDDASIAKLISIHLAKTGFDCRIATNGSDGFSAFEECKPHLVLSDISMPGMDGIQMTAKIRETSQIPVILMTAANTDANEMAGFKTGADDYVSKPFNPQLLVARIVANLRRVYRYNVPPAVAKTLADSLGVKEAAPEPSVLPEGWTRCDACSYIGPEFKFDNTDEIGRRTFVCPHCRNTSITFAVT